MKDLEVEFPRLGNRRFRVVGPAWRLTHLAVGDRDKYGDTITKHTPDWARVGYEKVADRVTMLSPRESGHEIEGRVRIKGKTYAAFTDGGENPDGGRGMIIVRQKKR